MQSFQICKSSLQAFGVKLQELILKIHDYANYKKYLFKKTYFSHKIHTMIIWEGFIIIFEITPTPVDNKENLHNIIENRFNLTIFGDKDYVGDTLAQELKEQDICLISLKRANKNNSTNIQLELYMKSSSIYN